MNPILLAILLTLAWVPWGEAGTGEPMKDMTIIDPMCSSHGEPPHACTKADWDRMLNLERDPCLAKMEAAMRRMDQYIARAPWQPEPGQNREQIDEDFKQYMHQKYEAFKLWDAAKKDCWRDTK